MCSGSCPPLWRVRPVCLPPLTAGPLLPDPLLPFTGVLLFLVGLAARAVGLNYGVFRRKEFNATTQNILFYDMGSTSTIATVAGLPGELF